MAPHRLFVALVSSLVLGGLAAAGPTLAGGGELRVVVDDDQDLVRIERALVPELVELADWCHGVKLYRERDELWRSVLAIDPEHERARKALRYHFFPGRGWIQSSSYKLPKNRDDHALPEYEDRRRKVLEDYRIAVFGYLARERASLGYDEHERILRELLALDPADPTVRTALGETRLGERWVLFETATAFRRRPFIPSLARASLSATPEPVHVPLTTVEVGYGVFGDVGRATPLVRVLGTSVEENARAAKVTHAAGDYFRNVFRQAQPQRDDYTLYLLQGPRQRDQVLARMTEIDEKVLALVRQAGGGWMGKGNVFGEWDPDPVRRLDGATRQALGTMLMDAYGIDGRHGWAWEGIGLYLTYHLIGTRRTYFFQPGEYQPRTQTSLWWRLQSPELDWLDEGRELATSDRAPRLEFLLGRDVNSMTDQDMLMGYVLAAYLLEGRPDEVAKLLRRIGSGEHPVVAFESVLGHSIRQLEARIRRWLRETDPDGRR